MDYSKKRYSHCKYAFRVAPLIFFFTININAN